jgi:hypothetical protein
MGPYAVKQPYFTAFQPRIKAPTSFFRVYVLPRELVGVWAGDGKDGRGLNELDAKPLVKVRDDHPSSFSLNATEILSAQLRHSGFWRRVIYSGINQVARLRLKSVRGPATSLAFSAHYDAWTAMTLLSTVLGSKLAIEMEEPCTEPAFPFSGKTLLFYTQSHGNQVEFLDFGGRCYLWYPGNRSVVPGYWRINEGVIFFRYGLNTYNPVTGVLGGRWEPAQIDFWSLNIVDAQPGDVCSLATGSVPHVLRRHPGFRTVHEARLGDQC